MDYLALAEEYEKEAAQIQKKMEDTRKTMTRKCWEQERRKGRFSMLYTMYLELRCTAKMLREKKQSREEIPCHSWNG